MDNAKRAPVDQAPVENAESPGAHGEGGPAEAIPGLIELVLAEQAAQVPTPRDGIDGVLVGRILSLDTPDAPRVTFPQGPIHGVSARAMLPLSPDDVGRAVALMFEGGDPSRPIVMGRMATSAQADPSPHVIAEADGSRVEITAEEELVLRCGESSITLTRSGKIIIRGNYVLSRSSGVNRIQGGSVEIN